MCPPFDGFKNFDQEEIYKQYEAALLKLDTRNVIVDFDNATSFSALNVDGAFVKKILQTKVCGKTPRAVTLFLHKIGTLP